MNQIIWVNGNIIVESGSHQVKELIALATDNYKQIANTCLDNDLVITDKDSIPPYVIYCASGGISCRGINQLCTLSNPLRVLQIYQEEIEKLQRLATQTVDIDLTDVLNRQIYIGVIGAMELFLCDFLHCMVLGYRKYYEKYKDICTCTFRLKEITAKQWNVRDRIIESLLNINYHKIKEVEKLYSKILGINFESINNLENQILTRHKLVHRNGYPSKNDEYTRITYVMIMELINEVQSLVNCIVKARQYEIEKWLSN